MLDKIIDFIVKHFFSVAEKPTKPEKTEKPTYSMFTFIGDADILARTIFGEARGEGVRGMEAVASVILNRIEFSQSRGSYWWGLFIRDVCLKPYQFSCWNKNDPNREFILNVTKENRMFREALRIAKLAIARELPDRTGGATHYHTQNISPAWKEASAQTGKIGNHVFYKGIA